MNSHGVNILDEADGYSLILGITNNLELQLLPPQHRLLYEYLANETR